MSGIAALGQQLRYMACEEIADYLASLGVSSQGICAVRENQVDGEMFMELTENDIKDLFNIFKDRHLVRKILQGKDNRPVHHAQTIRETDFTPVKSEKMVSGSNSEPISERGSNTESDLDQRFPRQYLTENKDKVTSGEDTHILQSYVKRINPSSIYFKDYFSQTKHEDPHKIGKALMEMNMERIISSGTSSSEELKTSRSIAVQGNQSNILKPDKECPQNLVTELFTSQPKSCSSNPVYSIINSKDQCRFQSAISQFIHSSSNLPVKDSSHLENAKDGSSSIWNNGDDDQDDSRFIPSVLTYQLTQFSGLELLSRKAKQGRPNEAQRLGQMVIREASSRAGIWDDPPCLQLLSSKQKQLFFEYSFSMAPNLREYRDLLWKRLGEALLNRRKYLRDKVLGKRGRRPGDDSASQDSLEPADDFEDQIPDTSTSPVDRTNTEDGNVRGRTQWNRGPSSTVSRSDVEDCPVLVLEDSPDEEEKQTYPDSTMDNQHNMELDSETKMQLKSDLDATQAKRKQSLMESTSGNLSLLSTAACSALLKEEAEQSYCPGRKYRRLSDYWMDMKEEDLDVGPDPPQDIEKVNLHKRLFLSKYESSSKHHHNRADRKQDETRNPVLPVFDLQQQNPSRPFVKKEDTPNASISPENDTGISGQWDSFVMEEVPNMRIYSTIDRAITYYTGEELLAKKCKQGKPSEAQRLGQHVIRESAMMAKLWQDVPQSIRSITEEQKKTFFQCAFTLAPNLIPCRDMLWRRLGEALQNRRKYVRDRSLGKRPTKREQRLMKESLQQQQQQQESESDSQASLSSIQDIENIVKIKSENPDTCFLKP